MRSGRQSLGGNVLRDSIRLNARSPSPSLTSNRRVSFGGMGTSSLDDSSTEPQKDRRVMLEEWRAQVRAERENQNQNQQQSSSETPSSPSSEAGNKENVKRLKMERGASKFASSQLSLPLPLPPVAEGATAVERFRMRRKQKLMLNSASSVASTASASTCAMTVASADSEVDANRNSTPTPTHIVKITTTTPSSSICFDDDSSSVPSRKSISVMSRSSPVLNRRMSISGGPRRKLGGRGRKSILSRLEMDPVITKSKGPTIKVNASVASSVESTVTSPMNTLAAFTGGSEHSAVTATDTVSVDKDKDEDKEKDEDNADAPGLKSRIVSMKTRIEELEKEKMDLAMSKAPLEARLRQKEDQWSKEQAKYEQEISTLMSSSKEDSERLSCIDNQLEELQAENRQLQLQVRKQKALGAEQQSTPTDAWSRQLQNDRDVVEYKEKLRAAEEEIKSLRLEKMSIESEVSATNMELSAITRDFVDLQEEYEELQANQESNGEAEIQLQELTKEHTATLALLNATSGELASVRSQSKFDMDQKEMEWKVEQDRMVFEMSVLKTRAAATLDGDDGSNTGEDTAVFRARIEKKDRRIEQLEAEVLKGEQIRRAMHNKIQELRGNIRVFVRTRPFLPGDSADPTTALDIHPDGESLSIESKAKEHKFKFDKVFPPSSGQNAVFEEVSEFVQSALDGYHVCLFSYGQTGSGKTHTMQGSGSSAMRGIIPRAVEQVLNQAQKMKKQKWNFTMSASFLEIYNEELKDLLTNMNEGVINKSSGVTTRNHSQAKLSIRRERNGKSYVAGLKQIKIDTDDANEGMRCLKKLMAAAARARSVASTKMNAVSSRSHSVFMLHLSGVNEDSGTVVDGALNLCDLAGSERLSRSGAGNDSRLLKETQAINKSLSCLGDVFTALSNGSSHVPFRNSKLTYLLQDCLSGDGKALMFVNLSPTMESSSESLCSLRFAQRVNQVELGKATKHVSYTK